MTSMERKQLAQDLVPMDLVESLRQELLEAHEELYEIRRQLQEQLQIAAQIHRSLLPVAVRHPRIDVDVRFLPAEPLGTDYFQVRIPQDDPGDCYVTMCHISGQGIVPALLASRISSEAHHFIEETFSPADMVHALNNFIYDHFREAKVYVSFMAARIDLDRRRATYSGAGHPGAMLLRPGKGLVRRLASQHSSIGVHRDILKDDSECMLELSAGDRLLFSAEGVTRSTGVDGHPLGQSGLATIAAKAMHHGIFEMLDEVVERVRRFRDGPASEDVTLVVAEIK